MFTEKSSESDELELDEISNELNELIERLIFAGDDESCCDVINVDVGRNFPVNISITDDFLSDFDRFDFMIRDDSRAECALRN